MESPIAIIIGIIVFANLVYSIYSAWTLRRISRIMPSWTSADQVAREQLIHSRTSINTIYAWVALITFVLVFLGWNLQRNITDAAVGALNETLQVNVDDIRNKAASIYALDSLSRIHAGSLRRIDTTNVKRAAETIMRLASTSTAASAEIDRMRDFAQKYLERMQKISKQLYVVHSLPISKKKNKYAWDELKPVDGSILPSQFDKPPMVIATPFFPPNSDFSFSAIVTKATETNLEILSWDDEPYYYDVWIYVY